MIQIPVHNQKGQQVDTLLLDESLLGGQVRPALLKQAYVRTHSNQRQGTSATKNRSRVEGSTRKLYRQKGTGNARRGAIRTNIMRGGGVAHGKRPKSWRLEMPIRMRRLANCNALLAKAVDSEIKIVDQLSFKKPSSKQFSSLLKALKVDRSCLVALAHTSDPVALSARNLDQVSVVRVDCLNVFDLLNHRFLLVDKPSLDAYLKAQAGRLSKKSQEAA
ncbi:MAG: 50S ribosomal protein L4 [Phycisphaeraceae bacterium]|nr:50S ribosomal protein L4 [Phycisphaeraceae bacterium]